MFNTRKTLEEKIVEYDRLRSVAEVLGEEIMNDIERLKNVVDSAMKRKVDNTTKEPDVTFHHPLKKRMHAPRLIKDLECECGEMFPEGVLSAMYASHRRQFHVKNSTKEIVKFRNSNGQSRGRYSRFYKVIEKRTPTHRSLVTCKICNKHVTQGPMPHHVRTQHSEVLAIA